MLQNFKLKMHKRLLQRRIKASNVDRNPKDFDSAHTIGILFDATNRENIQPIFDYAEKLKTKGKRVDILAFVDDKARHNDFVVKHFNRRDIDFFMFPKSNLVQQFMNQPFDVLFCLFTDEILPLEYVSSLSKAHMRVGLYREDKTHCYDLMVDTQQQRDLKRLIKESDVLINVVNKKHAQYA